MIISESKPCNVINESTGEILIIKCCKIKTLQDFEIVFMQQINNQWSEVEDISILNFHVPENYQTSLF